MQTMRTMTGSTPANIRSPMETPLLMMFGPTSRPVVEAAEKA